MSVTATWPTWLRYGIAVLFVCAVGFIWSHFEFGRPFLLFFPAVILCGLFLNRGSGFIATIVAAVFSAVYLLPPLQSLEIASNSDRITFVIFVVICFVIAALVEALRMRIGELHAEKARSESLAAERQLLIEELSHRTRNDLASIVTLLNIQASNGPADARAGFQAAAERVRTIARAHRRLEVSGERVVVDSRFFLNELCGDIQLVRLSERPISLEVGVESHRISIDKAVPLGLIVNELVTNAAKHAFPNNRSGRITISFSRRGPSYALVVEDDGIGIPEGVEQGLGTRLLTLLASQLGSRFDIGPGTGGRGTRAAVEILVKAEKDSEDEPVPEPKRAGSGTAAFGLW